jgi:hypothetical protein
MRRAGPTDLGYSTKLGLQNGNPQASLFWGIQMGDLWLAIVVTSAICGTVGYLFAKKTGRNRVLWCALGVCLNVFGLAILSLVNSRRRK